MSNATSQGQPPTSEAPASPAQPPTSALQPKADSKTGDTTRAGEPTQSAAGSTANVTPPAASSGPPPAAPTAQPPTEKTNPPAPTPPPETKKDLPPPPTASAPPDEPKSTPTQPPAQQQPGAASSVVTVTSNAATTQQPGAAGASLTASSSTSTLTPINAPDGTGSGGLSQKSKVALGVSLPLAFIIMLAVAGLLWKKRKARLEAEEERRKEVEDYAYNPNADQTMPGAGLGADHGYDMREDSSGGYRGWGSTVAGSAGSAGRKASTTMSGGMSGGYSDAASPTRGNGSGEPLLDGSSSPEGEILGAMGPSAASNRAGDVRRGPSNASSSYSAAARSEGSDGGMYGNGATYEQYGQNPYGDQRDQRPQDLPAQAVIRDNPARRNARIENSSHYPQQSAGIAQNF